MRAITSALPGPRTAQPPEWDSGEFRVLFLRYERIGDLIMSTGVIRVIAQSHPTIRVDVLANPSAVPVLDNNPHVRRVIALDRRSMRSYRKTIAQVRSGGYQVVVDGRLNNPQVFTSTPLLMLASKALYRIGVSGGRNDRVYNVRAAAYDRSTHYVEGSMALGVPFGVDVESVDWQPEIFLTEAERARGNEYWRQAGVGGGGSAGRRLLVNLSASEQKRRWPDGKFSAVLRNVRANYPELAIAVMGLPTEWERVEKVASSVDAVAVPTPGLRDALGLVGTCDLAFTPDTSISHAASAFRIPSLVLLKREHRPYAPYRTPGRIILWSENEIAELPHERVSEELNSLIAQFGMGSRTQDV